MACVAGSLVPNGPLASGGGGIAGLLGGGATTGGGGLAPARGVEWNTSLAEAEDAFGSPEGRSSSGFEPVIRLIREPDPLEDATRPNDPRRTTPIWLGRMRPASASLRNQPDSARWTSAAD